MAGAEAKAAGLVVVIWSYPRGSGISKEGQTAVDVVAYAAQIACQLGANIVKVKPPTSMCLMSPDTCEAGAPRSPPAAACGPRSG